MRRLRHLRSPDVHPAQEAFAADLLGDVGKADSADSMGRPVRHPGTASGPEVLRRVRAGHGGLRLAGDDLHRRHRGGVAVAARADGHALRGRQSHQRRGRHRRQRDRLSGGLSPFGARQGSGACVGDGGLEPHPRPRRPVRRPCRLSEAGDAVPAVRPALHPRPVSGRRGGRGGRPERRRRLGSGGADPRPESRGDGDPVGRLTADLPLRVEPSRLRRPLPVRAQRRSGSQLDVGRRPGPPASSSPA